ncbi:MAG TPA: hypothetical protein EYP85_04085, partial [Armatimonadetes bacterium]|nr:hypothetical protein [Armatimonadota bacterium]
MVGQRPVGQRDSEPMAQVPFHLNPEVARMMTYWALWPLLMAGEPVVGPYSGVSLDNLLDTPILVRQDLVVVTGEDLVKHGEGMKLQERGGETVAVTEEGFFLALEVELDTGKYLVTVEAMGTHSGNDSFWLEVDGERMGEPLVIPINTLGKRTTTVMIRERGRHSLRLILREG